MNESFKALVVNKTEKDFSVSVQTMTTNQLPQGDVLIRVHYSGINYKDSLAAIPDGKIVKSYPFVPGIDLAGVVVSSTNPRFRVGDEVIATSYEIGVSHFGGFSEYARIPSEWIVPLPAGLSLKDAMIIGTAGFTAALSVFRLEENGLTSKSGKILVSGATGGVGSFAVSILSKLGYEVEASTGKITEQDYLKGLGAKHIISREEVYDGKIRALGKQKWAGAVDTIGGEPLASILSQIQYGGSVATCGLTAGSNLPSTVFPFILRGVNLLGIDSVYCPMEKRLEIWNKLANDYKPYNMEKFIQEKITIEDLPNKLPLLLDGKAKGRILVQL